MFLFLRFLINNKFFCKCLHYFGSNEKLEVHTVDCIIVYADLECILEKMEESHMYQHHRVFSIGYVHCSFDDSLFFYRFHHDKDCVAWFTEQLRDLAHNVKTIITANVLMVDFDYEKFNCATLSRVRKSVYARRHASTRSLSFDQYRGPSIRITT